MKHLPSSFLRFAGLLVVALAGCVAPQLTNDAALPPVAGAQSIAPDPTVAIVSAPTAQTFASALPSPTLSPTEQIAPASLTAQVSNSPLPSPLAGNLRLIYSLPQGVSFAYLPDWQVDLGSSYQEAGGTRTNLNVVPTEAPRYLGLGIHVYALPSDQEATLYHQAGDTWTYRESPVFQVPWAQELRIGDLDWHLYLQGYSEGGLFVRCPDLDYLFEKGALTSATLYAVHYEKSKQLAVSMSQSLLPDQLVMLDAQGMDAMYPEQFKVFSDILSTITFDP